MTNIEKRINIINFHPAANHKRWTAGTALLLIKGVIEYEFKT
jgi:hypothetical protein